MRFGICTLILSLMSVQSHAEDLTFYFNSSHMPPGLKMAESKSADLTAATLSVKVNREGKGAGMLVLNPNSYEYDDLGYGSISTKLPLIKLDCAVRFVKKVTIKIPESGRIAAPLIDVEWTLYEITGPQIVSKLFLGVEDISQPRPAARLLIHNSEGKVKHVIYMTSPGLPEPCHPGCFPAGTPISVAGGTKPVESIRVGDRLITVSAEGKAGTGTVSSVFITRNRLLEIHTEAGILVTTVTQPLALTTGVLRGAGDLKQGDNIYRWVDGKRVTTKVIAVEATPRYESVYNVVLGEPTLFIADGYLARSKPPAE